MHAYAYDAIAYKFTGKERDSETGLDNFGARYDSSSLGRFMTPDWAARPTTVPYAVFGDPQSLNLYGYVRNDPVSRADADGHCGPGEQEGRQANVNCNPGSNPGSPDNTKPAAQNLNPVDNAAVSAEKAAYEKKDALKKEFGGVVYSNKNGNLAFTPPKHIPAPGKKDSDATIIRPNDRPGGTTVEAIYHSHGDATDKSNQFSQDDLTSAWTLSAQQGRAIPSYIGDAKGGVYRYTPDINSSSPESDLEGRTSGQIVTIVPPQE